MRCLLAAVVAAGMLQLMPAGVAAQGQLEVAITYVTRTEDKLPPLSLIEPREVPDEGLAGASLGIADNQTTGQFLGHRYTLNEVTLPEDGDLAGAVQPLLEGGAQLFVADLRAEDILTLAGLPGAADALIFNARAQDDALRTDQCRASLFHVMPSYAMKADALAQYLVWKRWNRWFLIHGERPDDLKLAEAILRAARKFNGKIVEERPYGYDPTARRTDTGHVQVQRQMPLLTQQAPDYDILIAADESDVFAEYLPYLTWDPRPVAGSAGLVPTAWHRAFEAWGGTQMQNRFEGHAGRWMRERDYTAWLAVRSIGEAVTRTSTNDPAALRDYLRSDQFALGAFKGQALTFRTWNQQMRQPILLMTPRMLVSVSPQDEFLHQRTPLDSLGFDEPESSCQLQ
jgi:ABC transporter substrate binding protein (PQQ-dependent alcohol dehydrogenase system)